MRYLIKKILGLTIALTISSTVFFSSPVQANQSPHAHSGWATWYEAKGKKTASGEFFDARQMTAAHPSLPIGTIVKVTRASNQKSVLVRINDRCRCSLDLSKGAAAKIDLLQDGRAKISFEVYSHNANDDFILSSFSGAELGTEKEEAITSWKGIY